MLKKSTYILNNFGIIIILLLFSFCGCSRPSANRAFKQGVWYEREKVWDKAISSFSKAIDIEPKHFLAYRHRGDVYSQQGKHKRAMIDLNKAVALKPKDASGYYVRGLVHFRQGNFKNAIEDYTRAIEADKNHTPAIINRGVVYQKTGDFRQALLNYNQVLKINPKLAIAYGNRAGIYIKKKKYGQAILDLKKAIKINLHEAQTYYSELIRVFVLSDDLDKAVETAKENIRNNPNSPESYHDMAVVYYIKGMFKKSYEYIDKAYAVAPENKKVIYFKKSLEMERDTKYGGELPEQIKFGEHSSVTGLAKSAEAQGYGLINPYQAEGDVDLVVFDFGRVKFLKPKEWLRNANIQTSFHSVALLLYRKPRRDKSVTSMIFVYADDPKPWMKKATKFAESVRLVMKKKNPTMQVERPREVMVKEKEASYLEFEEKVHRSKGARYDLFIEDKVISIVFIADKAHFAEDYLDFEGLMENMKIEVESGF